MNPSLNEAARLTLILEHLTGVWFRVLEEHDPVNGVFSMHWARNISILGRVSDQEDYESLTVFELIARVRTLMEELRTVLYLCRVSWVPDDVARTNKHERIDHRNARIALVHRLDHLIDVIGFCIAETLRCVRPTLKDPYC